MNYFHWFRKELNFLKSKNCEVKVIITRTNVKPHNFDIKSSSKSLDDSSSNLTDNLTIKKLGCRPKLKELVKNEISKSECTTMDVAFIGYGLETFNEELRSSVAEGIPKNSSINLDFQAESFIW